MSVVLFACNSDKNDCSSCFDLDKYSITAKLIPSNLYHSDVDVELRVQNPNEVLEKINVVVYDSDGIILYIIPIDESDFNESIKVDLEVNYLIQNEEYSISAIGFLHEDSVLLSQELAETKIQTGLWDVEYPKGHIFNIEADDSSVVFDSFIILNDFRGKRVTMYIYEGDVLIDTFVSDWLLRDEFRTVKKSHDLYNITFTGLKNNTQYNLFVSVLCLGYDYDLGEYGYYNLRNYAATFKTDI